MAKRVLIVDDEPNTITSLRYLMEQAGYAVAVAHTGDQAVAAFDAFAPDIVLLDLMLSGPAGLAVVQHVRRPGAGAHAAVILLSAKGRDADVAKAMRLGADGWILKPFSSQELLAEVNRFAESVV